MSGRRDVPPPSDPELKTEPIVPNRDLKGAMVINGWRRQVRMLKHHGEEDRNILLFATLTLGVAVIVFALWSSTP